MRIIAVTATMYAGESRNTLNLLVGFAIDVAVNDVPETAPLPDSVIERGLAVWDEVQCACDVPFVAVGLLCPIALICSSYGFHICISLCRYLSFGGKSGL